MSTPRSLAEDLAKLDGLPPYDVSSNTCRDDAYFARDIERHFGAPIDDLRRRVTAERDAAASVQRPARKSRGMQVSLAGLTHNLRAFVDEVVRRAEAGKALDDEFLYEWQPGYTAFGFEELVRHLGLVQAGQASFEEFFEVYVDAPAPREEG